MPIVNVTDISKDHVAEAIARMEMDIKTVATAHRGLSSGYMKLLRELQSLTAENAALRSAAVEACAIARVWATVWHDKLSTESIQRFAELEQQILKKEKP